MSFAGAGVAGAGAGASARRVMLLFLLDVHRIESEPN